MLRRKIVCCVTRFVVLTFYLSQGLLANESTADTYCFFQMFSGNLIPVDSDTGSVQTIYQLDKDLSDPLSLELFTVGRQNGRVCVGNISVLCSTSSKNGLQALRLVIRTIWEDYPATANFLRTWLTVGNLCSRQEDAQINIAPKLGISKLEVSLTDPWLIHGPCLPAFSKLAHLSDFLPHSVKADCNVFYYLETPADSNVEVYDEDLRTKHDSCSNSVQDVQLSTRLKCKASSQIASSSFAVEMKFVSHQTHLATANRFKNGMRFRRAPPVNNPPVFAEVHYVEHVPEEQQAGYIVCVVSATDADTGDAGKLTYSLVATKDGRSQQLFAIDSSTGTVTTTQQLDRESIPVHYLKVVARDGGKPVRTGETRLTVHVDDINDHTPRFESDIYTKSVSESIGVGSAVQNVRASDEDFGRNGEIVYSFMNAADVVGIFDIDPQLGSITTVSALDRETTSSYRLIVAAIDNAVDVDDRRTATAIVEVTVLDENDNRPQFDKHTYDVEVREDVDPKTSPVIATIHATDKDAGQNGIVRYSITGWNYGGTFTIDPVTGALSVTAPLNYEQIKHYVISIRAQDSGTPPAANNTLVNVRVIDVNDNSPKFYAQLYQASVSEDIVVGTTVVKVQAYDADSGPHGAISYRIIDEIPDESLVVDRDTGVITTVRGLDRENFSKYSFRIEAADGGEPPRTATANVEITVRDVNDNAPVFNPNVYRETVSEDAFPGLPIVMVTASDADDDENARITYSIQSGNERGSFAIIGQVGYGTISVAQPLSHRQQNQYGLKVVATDGVHSDTAMVYIEVAGANLHRPEFHGTPYHCRIAEDAAVGLAVFNVSAVDADTGENARLTYTMLENEAFRIDPVTGDIIVKQPLDRERLAGYTLTVTATDHGRPSKSDSADIDVIITDVNDNAPKFLKPLYTAEVSEDSFVGLSVLTVAAVDDDVGVNSRVRYMFEGIVDDFSIESTLGTIRTARELDRERINEYVMTVLAIDRGSPERTSSVNVVIKVEDVNDNAPQFETSNVYLSINENSPIGSTVGSLVAHDGDDGENAVIEYAIAGGADSDFFALTVRNATAILSTLIELDFEADKHDYVVHVQARSDHLFTTAVVRIVVEDVNDNAPILNPFTIVFNNYKDHFVAGALGRVPARDPDVKDVLRYRFFSGNQANLLHLDEETGIMRLDARLNSDMPTNGSLVVSVSDGINEVQAVCHLYVRLVTDDMLTSAVTVRLNNVDRVTFLSPLYHLFVSAVAGIVPATQDSVFVVNIQDDVEVAGHQILNVSFAVRRRIDKLGRDVFYQPQFLRERIYMQRALLTKLSTLEVLPFDDNLCIREPCLNFEECISVQRFGNASEVVSTDAMLFRPLQLSSTFSCRCPRGFAGMQSEYLCDMEVNLCYSSPCNNNGSCIQREGGYVCMCPRGITGTHCEINMQQTCSPDVCRGGSQCVQSPRGGFRCERCNNGLVPEFSSGVERSSYQNVQPQQPLPSPQQQQCVDCSALTGTHTEFCELRSRGFTRGSFLTFAPLKQRHRFTIELSIATRERNALLFYNGRYNDRHDFIAMEIVDGHVRFSFSLGTDVTTVSAWDTETDGDVSDGQWHHIAVHYVNRTATLVVGSACDVELAVKYGQKIGKNSCADRAVQELDSRCLDVTETCHRFLDLTGPLQLGGLPLMQSLMQSLDRISVHSRHFTGCVRDFQIDGQLVDLGSYVWNNGTIEGCLARTDFCQSSPCLNSGKCTNVWNSYHCECPTGWSGKDCSIAASSSTWQLHDRGNLLFTRDNHGLANVRLPWVNSLTFRTRQPMVALLSIDLGSGTTDSPTVSITLQIYNGTIQYVLPQQTIALPGAVVNDGKWHYVEARWTSGELTLTLDYGQHQVVKAVAQLIAALPVGRISVGGPMVGSDAALTEGLDGCIKTIRVGNSPGVLLSNPEMRNAVIGCNISNICSMRGAISCPKDISKCSEMRGSAQCTCNRGRAGPKCERICDRYNPCNPAGTIECLDSSSSPDGYICRCNNNHRGRYCEQPISQVCPASWWGSPICGPCNCPKDRGFDPNCDKITGKCNCRLYHYRVNNTCYPCDCYDVGSRGRTCDMLTGQCQCQPLVSGRRCDQCASRTAEVTTRGCEVIYNACPRSFRADVWWRRTPFGTMSRQECPYGAAGIASRYCNGTEGWLEPDLSNCTSAGLVDLKSQLSALDVRQLELNTFVAKSLVFRLSEAARSVVSSVARLYESDIEVVSRIVARVLNYESRQTGLNLTHTQDRNFIQNVVSSIGVILDTKYKETWTRLHAKNKPLLIELMSAVENYTLTLSRNMIQTFTQPFDVVHENLVIGLDFVAAGNFTTVPLPKYNNKVQNPDIFDTTTRAILPMRMLRSSSTMKGQGVVFNGNQLSAIASYALYRTLGELLPPVKSDTLRNDETRLAVVNSPVFTLTVIDANTSQYIYPDESVTFDFRQSTVVNRTNPQCVYWSKSGYRATEGRWSIDGCSMVSRSDHGSTKHIRCQCKHLSTFAVLMDISDDENVLEKPFSLEISTYVGLGVSLLLLGVVVSLFWSISCIGGLDTNANTIRINLVMSLFIANAAFLAGIDRVQLMVLCKLIAIILHYFFLCAFAWSFIDSLHIYRRMTDIHDVNHGPMRFYYVVGYVIPGIIVGLSVGLSTDSYGHRQSCWMRIYDPLVWSFIGPVGCVILLSAVVFIAAWFASCQGHIKHADVDSSFLKYGLRAGMIFLPIMTLAVAFALLSVNNTSVVAFHYLFIAFTCLQSVFIPVAYILLSKETIQQLHYMWHKMHRSADITDTDKCIAPTSHYSSAASFDAGLNSGRISSSSSTSHSLNRGQAGFATAAAAAGGSSGRRHHMHGTMSPSTSKRDTGADGHRAAPFNDSDSDSDADDPRVELASSHSSDDDDVDNPGDAGSRWRKENPKQSVVGRGTSSSSSRRLTPTSPHRQHKRMPTSPHQSHRQQQQQYSISSHHRQRTPTSPGRRQLGSPSIAVGHQPINNQRVVAEVISPKGKSSSSSDSAA